MIDKSALEGSTAPKFNIDGLNTVMYDPLSLWGNIKDIKQSLH